MKSGLMQLLSVLMVGSVCSLSLSPRFTKLQVLEPFRSRNAFKVISGLKNFDVDTVEKVVRAATIGGASHVDIACRGNLVEIARKYPLPVCVSSINPLEFREAVEAGADMLEIGNYDTFYEQGIIFSPQEILDMTKQTKLLYPEMPLSVTVPHVLTLADQITLAKKLEALHVDIIQTEGKKVALDRSSMNVQEFIQKASPTMATAFALARAVQIPVMCSSGITEITAPIALSLGAKGVGVGSVISSLKDQHQMTLVVSSIAKSIGRLDTPNQRIAAAPAESHMDDNVDDEAAEAPTLETRQSALMARKTKVKKIKQKTNKSRAKRGL